MSKKENQAKSGFVKLFLSITENDSSSKEAAKEFLSEEGVNTEKLVLEGLKKIKKMELLANAKRTEQEMIASEKEKEKAREWVEKILTDTDFSLENLIGEEELAFSFRNVEQLSQEDIKNILIKHFTLKFRNQQKK